MSTSTIVLIAMIVGFVGLQVWQARSRISSEQARALVEEGAVLIDVRSPGEYAGGHVEGALNIPVGELGSTQKLPGPDTTIVLYCASGMRSARAKSFLSKKGYSNVHDLGPMSAW